MLETTWKSTSMAMVKINCGTSALWSVLYKLLFITIEQDLMAQKYAYNHLLSTKTATKEHVVMIPLRCVYRIALIICLKPEKNKNWKDMLGRSVFIWHLKVTGWWAILIFFFCFICISKFSAVNVYDFLLTRKRNKGFYFLKLLRIPIGNVLKSHID